MVKDILDPDNQVLYQIRLDFEESAAEIIRNNNNSNKFSSLMKLLDNFNAKLTCQYDAFRLFTEECEVEENTDNALYRWTKDVLNDSTKVKKYKKSFTIYIREEQLYKKKIAFNLKENLLKLKYKEILKINIYNSEPKNNPQPPSKYH